MPSKPKNSQAKRARPTLANRQAHAQRIALRLAEIYPDATCALTHQNPFELLVATILSAQCTDKKVNEVTPTLFNRFPSPASLANAAQSDVESIIRPTGFYRNKAKNLIAMSQTLVRDHQAAVPPNLDALTTLAGVGRKTAHVVLGTWFRIPSGVVVDTHVKRLARRMGLTKHTEPAKVELDLMATLPQSEWIDFSHRMIQHGRAVCTAPRPKCDLCQLADLCPRVGLPKKPPPA